MAFFFCFLIIEEMLAHCEKKNQKILKSMRKRVNITQKATARDAAIGIRTHILPDGPCVCLPTRTGSY